MLKGPRVRRRHDGDVQLSGLPPWMVGVLQEIEVLLAPDQPGSVRQRLFPDVSADPDEAEEWRRLTHPELFALLASARDVLVRDLQRLEERGDGSEQEAAAARLLIPSSHVNAWLHALGAARLTLAELHEIEEEDLHEEELVVRDDQTAAVARIHVLGWLQQLLVECEASLLDAPTDEDWNAG